MLDDGRVTDSQGRVVSFKNTIIIMTSNLGSANVLEAYGDKQQARDLVMMSVRSHFRPEFINRVDEFIMFDPLEQEQIKAIVRLQVGIGFVLGFMTSLKSRLSGCPVPDTAACSKCLCCTPTLKCLIFIKTCNVCLLLCLIHR